MVQTTPMVKMIGVSIVASLLTAGTLFVLGPEDTVPVVDAAPRTDEHIQRQTYTYDLHMNDTPYLQGNRWIEVPAGQVVNVTVAFTEAPFTGLPWDISLLKDDGSKGLNGYETIGRQRSVESPSEVTFRVEGPAYVTPVLDRSRTESPHDTVVSVDVTAS